MSEGLPVTGPTREGTAVTRSAQATTGPSASRVARRRIGQPVGWWGMALFLCSEVTIFGTLIATYYYLDFGARHWPPPGIKPPELAPPLIATAWLVLTSIPMFLAARGARRGDRTSTAWLITVALAMQCGYLAAQVILFRHDLNQFHPQGSAYGSIYFTLLAVHHAHVLLGIWLDVGILYHVLTRGLNNYWLIGVRGLAMFWHVVNVLAVLVVFTQVTPSL